MRPRTAIVTLALAGGLALGPLPVGAQVTADVPAGRPDAVIDLGTPEGIRLVRGQWRYRDARIVEVGHRSPGPDLRPSGSPIRTWDIEPHAGAVDFDDSDWEAFEAASLQGRRGTGRLSLAWYRIRVTIPARIGSLDPTGADVVFEIVVDDYAEVWVDGRLPLALGQAGGPAIRGWNSPNRVVAARGVRPGQQIQIAVLGINGPLSDPPGNFIWVRSATLDIYRPGRIGQTRPVATDLVRLDPALDEIVTPGSSIEQLAGGFTFAEGPVWVPGGYLLFSDPNDNVIYRWAPDGQVSVFRTKSGYAGLDIGEFTQPGSNGLALDPEGRLTIAEHGNRRLTRLERNGVLTVLADRFDGRRLNSPNDLVYRSDGALYFTDPPFGLPRGHDDPRRELSRAGVYRLAHGELRLVAADLAGPNGLAFSPDERYLYVGNWDPLRKVVMRYEVGADGGLGAGQVLVDLSGEPGEDAIDGVKVDQRGNVYVSGPGGLWIVSAEGRRLGLLRGPEHPHNMAWGDGDGRTLYLTARTGLYRIRLRVPGAGAVGPGATR